MPLGLGGEVVDEDAGRGEADRRQDDETDRPEPGFERVGGVEGAVQQPVEADGRKPRKRADERADDDEIPLLAEAESLEGAADGSGERGHARPHCIGRDGRGAAKSEKRAS